MLMGEVRFLRAYAYFTLYRYYGGVPLIIEPTGPKPDYVPRATRQEMFKFLYDEMAYALDKCLDNRSGIAYGRVSCTDSFFCQYTEHNLVISFGKYSREIFFQLISSVHAGNDIVTQLHRISY